MTPLEMRVLLAEHGCTMIPIVPEGRTAPNGYTLRGPRGRKGCVGVDANGNVDGDAVRLWVDCVDYAEARRGGFRPSRS